MKITISFILVCLSLFGKAQNQEPDIILEVENIEMKYSRSVITRKGYPRTILFITCSGELTGVISNKLAQNNDTITLRIESKTPGELNTGYKYSCEYKYNRKHGIYREYFDFSELREVCIMENPLVKIEGNWKNGSKHGRWIYYNLNGTIKKVDRYKKGKLQ